MNLSNSSQEEKMFSTNLQYLRKINHAMTQDQMAEKMGVSRQTVSKWESGEAYPEMEKLFRLCDLFSCSMDALLRENMDKGNDAYSPVRMEILERFRMARYVMISPQPENDVQEYMKRWAKRSGLLEFPDYKPEMIGWDFPFVSNEQKNVYSLRGYAAAYIIPEDFTPACDGAELKWQEKTRYAVITVKDPFTAAFERIPGAYQRIIQYLGGNGLSKKYRQNLLCFEKVYEKDGVCFMDVYIAEDAVMKTANVHSIT